MKTIQPLHDASQDGHEPKDNPAADLIRQKINALYSEEPSAKEEIAEAEMTKQHRSKHQQFMHELNSSGKSLAEIQTAWHNYYIGLSNEEKHQVWQEFYANHGKVSAYAQHSKVQAAKPQKAEIDKRGLDQNAADSESAPTSVLQTAADIKKQLLSRIEQRAKAPKNSHLRSLGFGLSMGAVVASLFLFSFFNERFIAPFISPSKTVSSTPLITDSSNSPVDAAPKIVIPKINVEIPVVYDEPSIEEAAVQKALERGVLHYGNTPNPGEQGNGVIFGHSSNNILNKGKYKFAFVMLRYLEVGDTFMLHKDGKRYVYRVYEKRVVKPEEVSVLNGTGKPASFTLITCDPPGTSINRLVVFGEQISPDPISNAPSSVKPETAQQPAALAGNAPSLWQRIKGWFN